MEVLYLIEVIEKIQILATLQTSSMGKDYIDIFRNDFDREKNKLHTQLHHFQVTLFCLRGSRLKLSLSGQ